MSTKKIISENYILSEEDSGYLLCFEKGVKVSMLRDREGGYSFLNINDEYSEIECENVLIGCGNKEKRKISLPLNGYISILNMLGKTIITSMSENCEFN